MKHSLKAALAVAALTLAAMPAMAQAAPDSSCVKTLWDSAGARWDLDTGTASGAIGDGGIDTDTPFDMVVNRSDSYDTWPFFSVSTDGTWNKYDGGTAACTSATGDREIIFPSAIVDGLSLSRRVYVPDTGTPFARFLNVLSNPTAAPVTVTVDLGSSPEDFGDLGSDSDTQGFSSSSGDANATPDDAWVTTWDGSRDGTGAPDGDPGLGHLWGTTAFSPLDRLDGVVTSEYFDELFTSVTVAPGQTLTYMQVESQQKGPGEAGAVVAALAAEPAELYAGMSDADKATVQNFCAGDCDRDGRTDGTAGTAAADNCPSVANADQANLDGDALGDACDDDIDGDGASNAVEAGNKSDPRKADTDGDGVKDGADACPIVAGKGANGCPRFDDATAPTVKVTGLKSKLKRKSLSKGIKGKVSCNEPCSFTITLVGSYKGAKIAKTGDIELGSKKLKLGTGSRSFTVKPSKTLGKRVRKGAKLRVVITASDASHNSKTTTKTVKIT